MPQFLLKFRPEQGNVPKPWGRPAEGPTFCSQYPCEFRQSQIVGAGRGFWAKVDIPAGVMLRRVAVADGTLLRIGNAEELKATGWDTDELVSYGIGHHKDPSAIFFLNPGTAMNHADSTRGASVRYNHEEDGVLTLWTTRPVKAGEEMFNDYGLDFGPCAWYDELQKERGNTPLSQLSDAINKMYSGNPEVKLVEDQKMDDIQVPQFLLKFVPEQGNVPKPWGRPAEGPTFSFEYPCEFRQSQIAGAGRGFWAKVDIPAGVMLRRVAVADGTLIRISSQAELEATGWDIDESVNYGIGHHKDPSSIFFLNPGTAMNHADTSRGASVKYNHEQEGVL